jgi:hypothetical protein
MVTAPPARTIERVPVLLIGLLEAGGLLPQVPHPVAELPQRGARRDATLAEAAALTWLVAWDGPKLAGGGFRRAAGVASYRDTYDQHTSSDVREITHIAGSARSVRDLLHFMRAGAPGRLMGVVDARNARMLAILAKLGAQRAERVVFEAPA